MDLGVLFASIVDGLIQAIIQTIFAYLMPAVEEVNGVVATVMEVASGTDGLVGVC